MDGILSPLLSKLKPHRRSASEPGRVADADRLADQALVEAMDRAMDLGRWDQVERLAQNASHLSQRSVHLLERLARLRFVQGRPDLALSLISAAWSAGRERSASMRLLYATCLARTGDVETACTTLTKWSVEANAPLEARLLLALLEWERGDEHAAEVALRRNMRHVDDQRSLELLVLIAARRGDRESLGRWSDRLRQAGWSAEHAFAPALRLTFLGDVDNTPDEAHIARLARELISNEEVIPAIVEAQRRRPQTHSIELIYQTLRTIVDRVRDQASVLEALARLAILRGDRATAAVFAQRGLRLRPMSVSLNRLWQELIVGGPVPGRGPAGDTSADTREGRAA